MAGAATGLERALLASLALHGVVLAGVSFPEHRADAVVPAPLAARLVEAAIVEEQKAVPAPVVVAPKSTPVPRKDVETRMRAVTAPTAPSPAAAPAPPVLPAAIPAPPPQPVAPAAVARADPALVGQYRAQVLGAAGRYKRYPEEARENNWSGDVAVVLAVDASGESRVGLRRSSGRAVLDQQALDMFRQAARTVPLPATLRGREFSLDLRAVYGLED